MCMDLKYLVYEYGFWYFLLNCDYVISVIYEYIVLIEVI